MQYRSKLCLLINFRVVFLFLFIFKIVNAHAVSRESSPIESSSKSFYLGGGMGAGINYFNPTNTTVSATNPDHASLAYRIFGGYNLNKNIAFEVGYTNFGYYNNTASGNSICNSSGTCGFVEPNPLAGFYNTELNIINTINSYSFDISTIARYNVTDNFNIFGRVGANYLNASLMTQSIISPQIPVGSNAFGPTVNQTTNAVSNTLLPLLGVGYEYNANSSIGIRFEYDYYFSVNMVNNLSINEGSYTPSAIFLSTVYHF